MSKTQVLGALSYEPKTICPYLDIRTKFDWFWPINWSNINIFKWNQLYIKGKPKLHILYDYQLNIYLTVDSVFKKSQKMNKIAHISVRDIFKTDFAQLKFWVRPLKKFGGQILKNAWQISEFGRQIFLKA